jgi:hypothetical protein
LFFVSHTSFQKEKKSFCYWPSLNKDCTPNLLNIQHWLANAKKKIENILLNHAYNPAKWDTNWVTYEKTALSHRQARQEVQVLINIFCTTCPMAALYWYLLSISGVHCLVSPPSPPVNVKRWNVQIESLFSSHHPCHHCSWLMRKSHFLLVALEEASLYLALTIIVVG